MDIRNFFKKQRLEESNSKIADNNTKLDNNDTNAMEASTSTPFASPAGTLENVTKIYHELDIGNFINHSHVPDDIVFKALKHPWTPEKSYDFKNDSLDSSRTFRYTWLHDYPEMSYSAKLKGVLCRTCVLFKPHVDRGIQGAFILKEFTKYKKFHECAKLHLKSKWHRESINKANNFSQIIQNKRRHVAEMMNSVLEQTIENNRKKLLPIVKTIVFCAINNIPFRGKTDKTAIFSNLLQFRIDAGDSILSNHLQNCPSNATYISHRVQNELIGICNDVLRENIIEDAKKSPFFSIIADESCDISGIEQLSIGIRFISKMSTNEFCCREEFLGFVPLERMDAEYISETIISSLVKFGLDLSKMAGQAYDGCSTMAGKISGVQKRIQDQYPLANFYHCSSHRLNLVINDLNEVCEIRNAVGTIKSIINFFRESSLRRKHIPNIPLFCETRWTAKYKSVRIFKENLIVIIEALLELSLNGNINTTQRSSQLYHACTNSTFLVCLYIISAYSSMLEPVANNLQGVDQNLLTVRKQITSLVELIKNHRNFAKDNFHNLWENMETCLSELNIELTPPRTVKRQTCRTNIPSDSPESYYRRSIFIPYLDSLITSLEERFPEENDVSYSIFNLAPSSMKKLDQDEYERITNGIFNKYGTFLENYQAESATWYHYYKTYKDASESISNVFDALKAAEIFYPSVFRALCIGLIIPATTCTAERSFSTLRKVKTWLRSTMSEGRLDALCMMYIHRNLVNELIEKGFYSEIIDRFGQDRRRLQLVQ